MDKIFKFLGRKAGETFKKTKWVYASVLGSDEEAIKAEYQFGLVMAKEIRANASVLSSNLLDDVASKLVERLNTKRKFNFYVLVSPEVNAFALPGGFVFFTDSLLKFCTDNRDELAFVLAHEIAHIIKGHSFNKLLAEYSLAAVGKFIKVSGVFGQIAKEATKKYLSARYSRENEIEADEFAVRLISAAKFNPLGALNFFGKLAALKKDNNSLPDYFSTHPSTEERINRVNELLH